MFEGMLGFFLATAAGFTTFLTGAFLTIFLIGAATFFLSFFCKLIANNEFSFTTGFLAKIFFFYSSSCLSFASRACLSSTAVILALAFSSKFFFSYYSLLYFSLTSSFYASEAAILSLFLIISVRDPNPSYSSFHWALSVSYYLAIYAIYSS